MFLSLIAVSYTHLIKACLRLSKSCILWPCIYGSLDYSDNLRDRTNYNQRTCNSRYGYCCCNCGCFLSKLREDGRGIPKRGLFLHVYDKRRESEIRIYGGLGNAGGLLCKPYVHVRCMRAVFQPDVPSVFMAGMGADHCGYRSDYECAGICLLYTSTCTIILRALQILDYF